MQKSIRAAAIVAAALIGMSLMLLAFAVPFQPMIARASNYPSDAISALPIFPWSSFFIGLLQLCCVLPLIFTDSKKGGLWLEFLLFVCMSLLISFLSALFGRLDTAYWSTLGGESSLQAYSFSSQVASFCKFPAIIGIPLVYAVCGMRIASKVLHKTAAKQV